jgi:hypothetical protein
MVIGKIYQIVPLEEQPLMFTSIILRLLYEENTAISKSPSLSWKIL